MLTVAEERLQALAEARGKQVVTHLYGQEINPETYAVCKADMLLKGEGPPGFALSPPAQGSANSHAAGPLNNRPAKCSVRGACKGWVGPAGLEPATPSCNARAYLAISSGQVPVVATRKLTM